MITELSDLLDDFPGETNRTRCFTHILNLVAKSIIKQFDVPKARADEVLDDAANELAALAVDLDLEERLSREEQLFEGGDEDGDAGDDDDFDGWTDVRAELPVNEREVLDKSLQPVRLVLVKASHLLFHNFSTYQFLSAA
jgi:hypothetical protein